MVQEACPSPHFDGRFYPAKGARLTTTVVVGPIAADPWCAAVIQALSDEAGSEALAWEV